MTSMPARITLARGAISILAPHWHRELLQAFDTIDRAASGRFQGKGGCFSAHAGCSAAMEIDLFTSCYELLDNYSLITGRMRVIKNRPQQP